jgi:hypothetical protein
VEKSTPLVTFEGSDWNGPWPDSAQDALEHGALLAYPRLEFGLTPEENAMLTRGLSVWRGKNISRDPDSGQLTGIEPGFPEESGVAGMMARFAATVRKLVLDIAPGYESALRDGRASLRPVEIAGRSQGDWRSDDSRLHVDAFPTTPTGGGRILRVFANVDPQARPRVWRIGETFEPMAAYFLPRIKRPVPGSARLLHAMGRTRTRRSVYDHCMLQLHDMAKGDRAWQASVHQREVAFGRSVWMAFTDQVPHAATSGCNALECTFYLPAGAQRYPELSPLKVLERLARRRLAAN